MGWFDFLKPSKNSITASFPVESLEKAVIPVDISPKLEGLLEKSKVVFDLESTKATVDNIYAKLGRLSDKELRGISQYDSIVSLIITTRCNQVMPFGGKSKGKYQRGFVLREQTPVQDDPNIPATEKEAEADYRTRLSSVIAAWISNCGSKNEEIVDYVFENSDSTFKKCSLSDFMSAQCRNLLTFGRYATQIIRNKDGIPIMWRPIPVETLYRVIDGRLVNMTGQDQDVNDEAAEDAKEWNKLEEDSQPIAYVQRINGKNVSFFTETEVKIGYYQKQAFEGLNGYPLAPIELAYYAVLMNFHSQMYLQNAFTKGLGSKGVIVLKTQDGAALSQDDVENFRKQFSNYVARNDNSATIPVISGPIEVNWIPLSATAKDLEYVNLFIRVLQLVAASFQISLHEIGFGGMDPEQPTLADGMKQDQVIQGEERGLRMIIEELYRHLYDIIEEAFPQAKDVFYLDGVGLGQNTKEADLAIYKEELQTSGTFAKIWSDSERSETFPYGGHVPTSPVFHENVAKYMKYSKFMYYFFHEEDAMNNPAYDFIIDPALNEAYQTLKNEMPDLQRKQAELDVAGKEAEIQQMQTPQEPEVEKASELPEMNMEAEKQKMQLEKLKHAQKMKHEREKHHQKLALEREKQQISLRQNYMNALNRPI